MSYTAHFTRVEQASAVLGSLLLQIVVSQELVGSLPIFRKQSTKLLIRSQQSLVGLHHYTVELGFHYDDRDGDHSSNGDPQQYITTLASETEVPHRTGEAEIWRYTVSINIPTVFR